MTRFLRPNLLTQSEGLILIEIMMAVILLALLVIPLAGGVRSVAETADETRRRSTDYSGSTRDASAGDVWEWGETVATVWWGPGPTLHLQAASEREEGCVVGLWADGWFMGEWKRSKNGYVEVDAPTLTDFQGAELVARVRIVEGTWGPPWRLLVPAADGESLVPGTAADGDGAETVVHVPAVANPALGVSWADVAPGATLPSPPFVIPSPGRGTHEISLDGRKQSWKAEMSRDFDIYF